MSDIAWLQQDFHKELDCYKISQKRESFCLVSVGVLQGLQEVILAYDIISLVNTVMEMNRP